MPTDQVYLKCPSEPPIGISEPLLITEDPKFKGGGGGRRRCLLLQKHRLFSEEMTKQDWRKKLPLEKHQPSHFSPLGR